MNALPTSPPRAPGTLRYWRIIGGFASLLAGGVRAVAAENTGSPLSGLSLEELGQVHVETIRSASRREQSLSETPSAVSVVTGDEIRKAGSRTLGEVLNRVRGFYTSYDRNYAYLGARGFSQPGDYSGRFPILVDGHRINDAIYDSANIGTDFPLDVDLIDRVEIVRGPGTSLYGNNAVLGVINVITRSGSSLNGGEVAGSYGSYDTWTGRGTYGQRLSNGADFLVSLSGSDSDGEEEVEFPYFTARDLDGGWYGNAFASVSYSDFYLQGGISRRHKDWPIPAYGTVANSQDPRLSTVDERAWTTLRFQRELGDEWMVMARTYLDSYELEGNYPYDYDRDATTRPVLNQDLARAISGGLEFSVSRPFGSHLVMAGADWRHDFDLEQRNWDADPYVSLLDSDEENDALGMFLQDEWRLREHLLLSGGIRADFHSAFGSTSSPRGSVIYSPWDPTTFKLLYGEAFRAPNAYELYYYPPGDRGDRDLESETIRSYEVVWEQRLGPRWRTTLSGYWNEVDEMIRGRTSTGTDPVDPSDDLFYYDNVGEATMRGIEAEIALELPSGVRASAAYTYADTEDKGTGRSLENAPQHLGKFNLTVPLWTEKVFASLEYLAMSERSVATGPALDPYGVVNFTLYSRELIRHLEISGSLYNLFDQTYDHPVEPGSEYVCPATGLVIPLESVRQDGRQFRLKITYRF